MEVCASVHCDVSIVLIEGLTHGLLTSCVHKNDAQGFRQDAVDRLRQRFRDSDAVFEQLRDASNPITAREAARLTDVFRTRVEENPAAYRNVFGHLDRTDASARQSGGDGRPGEGDGAVHRSAAPSLDQARFGAFDGHNGRLCDFES
jgi:hypothetical protein